MNCILTDAKLHHNDTGMLLQTDWLRIVEVKWAFFARPRFVVRPCKLQTKYHRRPVVVSRHPAVRLASLANRLAPDTPPVFTGCIFRYLKARWQKPLCLLTIYARRSDGNE